MSPQTRGQRRHRRPQRRAHRGAALLVAMLVLTLVATLAAGMVWQQSRAIAVEQAERTRAQAGWILTGALDLGRVLLRLDARNPGVDHLDEVWATPLAEASLSSMLAQDRDHNADDTSEAFLSGAIRDAQGRYNLRNLVDPASLKPIPAELQALGRLCEMAAVPPETAPLIAAGLRAALLAQRSDDARSDGPAGGSADAVDDAGPGGNGGDAPLLPQSIEQLAWLGLDAATVQRLRPYVELLPKATPLNINTASAEVLAGVIPGLDLASAKRLVARRPYKTLADAAVELKADNALDPQRLSVGSSHFVISGRLRMQGRVIEERVLVQRNNRVVTPLARWRDSVSATAPP